MEGHDAPAPPIDSTWIHDESAFEQARSELAEYFNGDRRTFDVALAPCGTDFRMRVWQELTHIPYGSSASYSDIATRVGNPLATRAVGGANHHNPIAVIIPCHRVVGKDGSLTGYGGGLDRKVLLLELEAAHR
jgi:methylated-DNA-[protein]-cysteine S-methyltransferase